jgi:hypothetical protein
MFLRNPSGFLHFLTRLLRSLSFSRASGVQATNFNSLLSDSPLARQELLLHRRDSDLLPLLTTKQLPKASAD